MEFIAGERMQLEAGDLVSVDEETGRLVKFRVFVRSGDLEEYEEAEKGLAVATTCVEIQERLLKPGLERQCCGRWHFRKTNERTNLSREKQWQIWRKGHGLSDRQMTWLAFTSGWRLRGWDCETEETYPKTGG